MMRDLVKIYHSNIIVLKMILAAVNFEVQEHSKLSQPFG